MLIKGGLKKMLGFKPPLVCLATVRKCSFVMFASFHPQYSNSDCQNKIERGEGVCVLERGGEKGEGGEVARRARLAAEKGGEEGEEKGSRDTRKSKRY